MSSLVFTSINVHIPRLLERRGDSRRCALLCRVSAPIIATLGISRLASLHESLGKSKARGSLCVQGDQGLPLATRSGVAILGNTKIARERELEGTG